VKKKLLITMGCSHTEGVGCYDISKMDKLVHYGDLTPHQSMYQRHNFHKLGWPNRLGKKLGYDKVINLGFGGSSTSGQVKQFSEKYLDKDLSEYDVLIVWLLSDASRISFYSNKKNLDLVAQSTQGLYKEYVRFISDIYIDTMLEQIFYIKMMEQICENKKYSLLLTPSYSNTPPTLLYSMYKSKYYLNQDKKTVMDDISKKNEYLCNIPEGDGHYNVDGYEKLANVIADNISKLHPHLIVNPPKDEIEWEWDGEPITHNIT
jgi:hypothetical protein